MNLGNVMKYIGCLIEETLAPGTSGSFVDFFQKLASLAGAEWLAEFKKFLRKESSWDGIKQHPHQTAYLKRLVDAEIGATTGKRIIAGASGVFRSHLDSDFKSWGLDQEGVEADALPIRVYELIKDGTFADFFSSISSDTNTLCFQNQEQIIAFCEEYPYLLRGDGYANFFLFKETINGEERFFVADVTVSSDGLHVDVNGFEDDFVWAAESRSRVVLPQLMTA